MYLLVLLKFKQRLEILLQSLIPGIVSGIKIFPVLVADLEKVNF